MASSAEQLVAESYRLAWDGKFYTRSQFRDYYGLDQGEVFWKSAEDKPAQSNGSTDDSEIGATWRRSAEQPVAPSAADAAQLAWRMDWSHRKEPVVQLITCGAGARHAQLSDKLWRLRKIGKEQSREGLGLLHGLKGYVSVYTEEAPYTKMLRHPRDATKVLSEAYNKTRDIYLDTREFSDRNADRQHTGRHLEIIKKIVAHPNWGRWLRDAHRRSKEIFTTWERGPILPIVVFCRSGWHRSIAASELLKGTLSLVEGWQFVPSLHISIDIEDRGCPCKNCRHDREICDNIRSSIALAVEALDLRDGRGANSGTLNSLTQAASRA